jgi:predicted transcriptional regulator
MIATTSQEAYDEIKDKLGDKQRKVFNAIQHLGEATNEEVSNYLDWPINCVCGRSNELSRFGVIGFESLKVGKSGRKAKAWSIRTSADHNFEQMDFMGFGKSLAELDNLTIRSRL